MCVVIKVCVLMLVPHFFIMGFQYPAESQTLTDVTNSVRPDSRTDHHLEDIKENTPSSTEVHCCVVIVTVVSHTIDIVDRTVQSFYNVMFGVHIAMDCVICESC